MVTPEIRKIIIKYINVLINEGIRVEKVIVYGSYASGNTRPDSDLDIAIVSSDFGKDKFEESKRLLQLAWRIDPRIEPIPISSGSYENDTWVPLIYEIREKGTEFNINQ